MARLSDTYINCHIGAAASNRGQFRWPLRGEACIGAHPEGHSRNVREARRNALLVMRVLLGQVREQDPLLLRIRIGSLGVAGDATSRSNKGDFVISRGVLYHKDKAEGQPICQLCVPEGKRVHSLKLAHNSASDYHSRVYETPDMGHLLPCWHGVCCARSRASWRLRSRPTKGEPCATSR